MSAGQTEDWRIVHDVAAVHALLQASDAHAARPGSPIPQRNLTSTRHHVETGRVHGLVRDGRLIGMVTLGPQAPFNAAAAGYDAAASALYMQRLAIDPSAGDPLLGLRLVRQALLQARRVGADVLRAETNPALTEVGGLLAKCGFKIVSEHLDGPVGVRYLECPVAQGE